MTGLWRTRVEDLMTPVHSGHGLDYKNLMKTVIDLIAVTLGEKRTKIKPDTPLLSAKKEFDSVALLEFILRLEDTFRLRLPDEDLDPDLFYSPETIVAYLRTRLGEEI